jgi:PncC family amidohydrolase
MTTAIESLLKDVLFAQNATIATAESCTGGLVASRLTDVSGSSRYVMGGVVAYDNRIKMQILNVAEATLIRHGAVSEQTAIEMAVGVRELFGVDYALSVTGIAGPSGGSAEKPVGLTYIGFAGANGLCVVERHVWAGDRIGNKQSSAQAALELAYRTVLQWGEITT